MNESAQKAIEVLVEIAGEADVDPDTRIQAACAILDLEKFQQGNLEKVTQAIYEQVDKSEPRKS